MILGDEWPRVNYSQAQSRARYEARHAHQEMLFVSCLRSLICERVIRAWARRRVVTWETNSTT